MKWIWLYSIFGKPHQTSVYFSPNTQNAEIDFSGLVYFSVYSLFKYIFLPSIDANSSSSISSKVLFRFGITAVALDAVSHSAAVLIRFLLEAGSISDSFTLYKNIIKFK